MAYDERRVVSPHPADQADATPSETEEVRTDPATVVERRPVRRMVVSDDDALSNVYAATQLIQTIVWSVVILVLLVVGLLALHVYAHLF